MQNTIFIAGVFDMENYGDLLFPLIADYRLSPHGFDVVTVAPSAQPPVLADAKASTDLRTMIAGDAPASAILIGGGYIINCHPTDFIEQYTTDAMSEWAMAGLWLGATVAAALRNIPILWNAPGVPHPFGRRMQPIVDAAVAAADYVSVRDRGGAVLLAPVGRLKPEVVPDTIADLARMWPKPVLADAFRTLMARKGADPARRYFTLHVRNRSMRGMDPAELAALIDAFAAEQNVMPLLVAVGASHEDPLTAQSLVHHLKCPHVLLDDPQSLKEITAALAHSSFYMGSSLHGYIASAAYDVPGLLVARPAYRKFAGFLEHTGRTGDLVRDWPSAFAAAPLRLRETPGTLIPQQTLNALDTHWSRIRAGIETPQAKRRERDEFLKYVIRAGMSSGGADWFLRPLLDLNPAYRSVPAHVSVPEGKLRYD